MTPEHKALVGRANDHIAMAKAMGNFGVASRLVADLVSALSAQGEVGAAGKLYGPFGWLNGCRGLSEDSWTLESDPLENSGEYFAIPLYALTDPFKEIGRVGSSAATRGGVGTVTDAMIDAAYQVFAGKMLMRDEDRDLIERMLVAALAALTVALASNKPVGDGYVLVPKEPTEAMLDALNEFGDRPSRGRSAAFYRAMLAASGESSR